MEQTYGIGEIAARAGISVDALRYYEREGLLEAVQRDGRGHRRYSEADAEWVAFLIYLRRSAMSIQQMRELADLRRRGDATLGDRLARFESYRDQIRRRVEEDTQLLGMLDDKIKHYQERIGRLAGGDASR